MNDNNVVRKITRVRHREAWVLARLLCGEHINGEVARLQGPVADLAHRMAATPLENRTRIYESYLGALPPDDANELRADVLAVDPRGSDPDRVATLADLKGILSDIKWAWPLWLPKGFITLLVAEPGVGKSILALLGVCRPILMGSRWPDGSAPMSSDESIVIWIEAEQGQQMLLQRAEAAGLPLDRIWFPDRDAFKTVRLDSLADVDSLRETIAVHRPELMVIDALSGAHDAKENNNDEMLPVMRSIGGLAREFQIPVLVIHHTNKKTEGGVITKQTIRGAGSIIQLSRVVWALESLEGTCDWLRLRIIKNNLGPFPPAIGVKIKQDCLEYGDAPQPSTGGTAMAKAEEFLEAQLRSGAKRRCDLIEKAQELGISPRTLDRAKKQMGLVTLSTSEWGLPADDPEPFT